MRAFYPCALALLLATPLSAQTLSFQDIRPGPGGSLPSNFTEVGGLVYFRADDGTSGRELWVSDGTADGTRLVEDIWPGPGDSFPTELAEIGGLLYFQADDGVSGRELWTFAPSITPTAADPKVNGFGLSAGPNPASETVSIRLDLPRDGNAAVTVYDALGRRVKLLHEGALAAGTHLLSFDARTLPNGVYLVRAAAFGNSANHRVTVVR